MWLVTDLYHESSAAPHWTQTQPLDTRGAVSGPGHRSCDSSDSSPSVAEAAVCFLPFTPPTPAQGQGRKTLGRSCGTSAIGLLNFNFFPPRSACIVWWILMLMWRLQAVSGEDR